MVKPIIKAPNPVLNKKSEVVKKVDAEIKKLISDLRETLDASKILGAGLSAPQIGVSKRVCIVRDFRADPNKPTKEIFTEYTLINPEYSFNSDKTTLDWEGCLSVPDTYGIVKRQKKIKVTALNEKGEKIKLNSFGFFAREIQHEVDHLDGILFTSKVIGTARTEKELDEIYKSL